MSTVYYLRTSSVDGVSRRRDRLALDDEGLLLVPAIVVPGRVDAVAALAVEGAEQGEHDLRAGRPIVASDLDAIEAASSHLENHYPHGRATVPTTTTIVIHL